MGVLNHCSAVGAQRAGGGWQGCSGVVRPLRSCGRSSHAAGVEAPRPAGLAVHWDPSLPHPASRVACLLKSSCPVSPCHGPYRAPLQGSSNPSTFLHQQARKQICSWPYAAAHPCCHSTPPHPTPPHPHSAPRCTATCLYSMTRSHRLSGQAMTPCRRKAGCPNSGAGSCSGAESPSSSSTCVGEGGEGAQGAPMNTPGFGSPRVALRGQRRPFLERGTQEVEQERPYSHTLDAAGSATLDHNAQSRAGHMAGRGGHGARLWATSKGGRAHLVKGRRIQRKHLHFPPAERGRARPRGGMQALQRPTPDLLHPAQSDKAWSMGLGHSSG